MREDEDKRARTSTCLILKGTFKDVAVEILIDTGANVCAVSQELYERVKKNGHEIEELPSKKLDIRVANGKRIETKSRQIWVEVEVQGVTMEFPAIVIKGLIRPIILGMVGLKMYHARVDVGSMCVSLRSDKGHKHCLGIKDQADETLYICDVSELVEETPDPFQEAVGNAVDENGIDCSHKMQKLINDYREVFGSSTDPVIGYQFQLELTDEEPFNCRQYPIPQIFRKEVRKQINTMLEEGIIRKSMTSYVSPIVIVKKKNNTIRFCLDARKLNSKTVARREKRRK